jgi:hypothetical protein
MNYHRHLGAVIISVISIVVLTWTLSAGVAQTSSEAHSRNVGGEVTVHNAAEHDVSPRLAAVMSEQKTPLTQASVEQTEQGKNGAPVLVTSFDGLGDGFEGPQGTGNFRNPSDNSLAVGPDHIVQVVNSKMAVFTKKGSRFDSTGRVLYGPVNTGNVFKGFGSFGDMNNGDAVVRYDQLATR